MYASHSKPLCTIASHQPRIKESEQTCVRQWRRGDRRDVSCPSLRSRVVERLDTMHAGRPIRSYGGVGRKPCLSLTATTLRSGYLATPCRCRCRCRRRVGSTNKRPAGSVVAGTSPVSASRACGRARAFIVSASPTGSRRYTGVVGSEARGRDVRRPPARPAVFSSAICVLPSVRLPRKYTYRTYVVLVE